MASILNKTEVSDWLFLQPLNIPKKEMQVVVEYMVF